MYNIKGPSKIVAKTARRGLPQNMETYRDHNKSILDENVFADDCKNDPKLIFQKKSSPTVIQREEVISPYHEEIIKFIHESWTSICTELEREQENIGDAGEHTTVCCYDDGPCDNLQDFKPFDLESFWGKRLYAYITSSVNAKN